MSDVPHYMTKGAECIEVIISALTPEEFAGFCKGNIIKYTYRAGDKADKQRDLEKAADYACMLAYGCWMSDFGTANNAESITKDAEKASKAIYQFGCVNTPDWEQEGF